MTDVVYVVTKLFEESEYLPHMDNLLGPPLIPGFKIFLQL